MQLAPGKARFKAAGKRRRAPRDHYDPAGYRRAIARACERAWPVPEGSDEEAAKAWRKAHHWHPHQLRHTAATRIRKEYGVETARAVLGHASTTMTGLYAEIDRVKAAEAMLKIG